MHSTGQQNSNEFPNVVDHNLGFMNYNDNDNSLWTETCGETYTHFEGVFEFYSNRLLSFNSSTVVDFSEKWKNEQKKNKTDENNMSS